MIRQTWFSYIRNLCRRYPDNVNQEENEAVMIALKTADSITKNLIELVYIKKTKTLQGAAALNYITYRYATRLVEKFMFSVARNLGLPPYEIPEERYRLEAWDYYIIELCRRYPNNLHSRENSAIEKALDELDNTTLAFITEVYINRTESPGRAADRFNVNRLTGWNWKNKFFRSVANNLGLI